MAETRKWRTKDGKPLKLPVGADTSIFGAAVLESGHFQSQMFPTTTLNSFEGSIDAFFVEHPDAIRLWVGRQIIINDNPTPPPELPPIAVPPVPPEPIPPLPPPLVTGDTPE